MLGLGLSAMAQRPPIITFDAPHAGKEAGQGTIPWGIVQGGSIMGDYIDGGGVYHGFLRTPDGKITEFEPLGAGKSAGQGTTEVFCMNPKLEIPGDYFDANNAYHGFVRTPDGKIITYDDPLAVTGAYMGTAFSSMNSAGVIECMYTDANGAWHGSAYALPTAPSPRSILQTPGRGIIRARTTRFSPASIQRERPLDRT
jgi:hypothetical protein